MKRMESRWCCLCVVWGHWIFTLNSNGVECVVTFVKIQVVIGSISTVQISGVYDFEYGNDWCWLTRVSCGSAEEEQYCALFFDRISSFSHSCCTR